MKLVRLLVIAIILASVSAPLSAYIISYSNQHELDNPIVTVANSSGVDWRNELLYLTYLFNDEMGGLTFRTYAYSTIDRAGYYRLASNVSNQITISASNVTLDLNGCTISSGSNGIVINSGLDNVTIKNGTIASVTNDGIQVNGGCTDITLDGITVNSATVRGVAFNLVTNGIIRNCELISSTTGIEMSSCRNILLENCSAMTNKSAGFSLVSSTTCALFDCQSISTGQGNTNQSTNIFGFVSSGGNGNIFQRCIANSTQGLTITGSQAVIAGFALLGTGTQCNSIIDCVAANSTSSPNGVTLPYGIWLEGTLTSVLSLTASPPIPIPTAQVYIANWSPDGQYFVMSTQEPQIRVYQYDRVLQLLDQVATATTSNSGSSNYYSAAWSPDGGFIATVSDGGTSRVRLYQFNRLNNTLIQLGNPLPNPTTAAGVGIEWSPDGLYFAVGTSVSPRLLVYFFDKVRNAATQVASSALQGSTIIQVQFSYDGQYIAAACQTNTRAIQIYKFNRAGNALSDFASLTFAVASGTVVRFSSDDKYLAVGTSNGASSQVLIYAFNKTAATLTQVAAVTFASTINGIDWSSDGKFLAVATSVTTASLTTYQFDRGANTLTRIATVNNGSAANGIRFSPDGKYIALPLNLTPFIAIYQAMSFPTGNVIMNNRVYCDAGNRFNGGIGISGSSIENMIIGNVAYNNPQNYAFCCNVFNQLFGDGPTGLQNIEGDINVPIQSPFDLPLNLARIQLLAQSLVDSLI